MAINRRFWLCSSLAVVTLWGQAAAAGVSGWITYPLAVIAALTCMCAWDSMEDED